MQKFVVSTQRAAGRELAAEVERLAAMLAGDVVNLNDLGKSLATVARAAHGVFVEAGLPSVRMDAAVKALDLRTKKSELERFVRSGTDE